MKRPWARTFDLIAAEYGWTDDQILDLPLSRIRQLRDVIQVRQSATWKRDVRVRERIMQHQIAATISAAGGKQASAYKVKVLPDDAPSERPMPSTTRVSQSFPVDPKHGLYTQEDITQRMRELQAQKGVGDG